MYRILGQSVFYGEVFEAESPGLNLAEADYCGKDKEKQQKKPDGVFPVCIGGAERYIKAPRGFETQRASLRSHYFGAILVHFKGTRDKTLIGWLHRYKKYLEMDKLMSTDFLSSYLFWYCASGCKEKSAPRIQGCACKD
jgi:hypothetical protein